MNFILERCVPQHLPAAVVAAFLMVSNVAAIAAPGAHGPDGEHLDAPTVVRATSALPRVEAKSEMFELVAELRGTELAIMVDRFETNEPVLSAKLEVESGTLRAVAAFRAEQGDYAVTDAAMVKALAAAGEHGLVFTLLAGKDSDLLDGTLVNAAAGLAATGVRSDHGHAHGNDAHGHDHLLERAAWLGAGITAVGLIGGIAWWRQRRREARAPQGGV